MTVPSEPAERAPIAAAVAIVLSLDEAGRRDVLLVRRAMYQGDPWSGHIALPGGRVEPEDSSLEATARRETLEETGIDLAPGSCIAQLPLVTPRSMPTRVTVYPFVFAYQGTRDVKLSHELVDSWWVPVASLRDPGAWDMHDVQAGDRTLRARGYAHDGAVVWGLTERILASFLENESSIVHGGYSADGLIARSDS